MTNISTQIQIPELLQKIGLSDREAQIYLALLKNGPMLPQHIAEEAGIKRTTLYEIFPEMQKSGVIAEFKSGKRRLFQATSPERLFSDYQKRYQEIKSNIHELEALYKMEGLRPRVEIFEGFEGLKNLYRDTLKTKKELLDYAQVTVYNQKMLKWLTRYYVPARVKRGFKLRVILPKEKEAKFYILESKETLREIRTVPRDKFSFRIEGMIYNDKIAFAHIEKGGPLMGIIIKSKRIADTQRSLFNLAWEGAEKYN